MTQENAPTPNAFPHITLDNKAFLFNLLSVAGPSGRERRAADVWKKEAETFARVSEDHYGNTYAEIGPEGAPAVALMGHLDEIGLIVSHIAEHGFIYFLPVGGWDPQVLVGQRIRLLAPGGDVIGVIGKKAIHVMDMEERTKASKIEDLWIDIGLDKEETQALIPVGTYGVVEQGPVQVGHHIVSRAIDNRIGAFAVLEALRQVHSSGQTLHHRVIAVGTTQEEIGLFGAQLGTYALEPIAAIAVDVTHETNQVGVEARKYGSSPFGSGGSIAVGPMSSPTVTGQLVKVATERQIPYTLGATGRFTFTDGDAIATSRGGVPTAVVSIPNRYMHSPSEMVDVRDVKAVIDLLAAWVMALDEKPAFNRL
ncbi:M20/M25/M40 family metallo-hydrolase [Deinococcus lacus]|uniref:M20/M25/M40 family metallo-hydrolase n=1 Tax=Deinococcus lacus TaxID=392561 RepID=A0ABW1YCA7_9DEIO